MRNKNIICTVIAAAVSLTSFAQTGKTCFAIIADSKSIANAGKEINLYSATLCSEGLQTVIIEDTWHNADSLRNKLFRLYKDNQAFEGAVFIGDIPVPMIRDAQHMSSAFKMDQERYAWHRSSIPSDRFYEDFDLQFEFLKPDTNNLYFYYSLKPESAQHITPDIYTGRIRIPGDRDGSRLRAYLSKVIDAHKNPERVEELLFFAGHGYNSESMTARMDEKASLLQQFPQLNRQENGLEYIDYTFGNPVKNMLLSKLSDEDIDIALLHHHGSTDAELLDAEDAAVGVGQQIESIKLYLRSKLSGSKNPDATKKNFMESLGVPESWFDGTFDKEQMAKDSTFWTDLDVLAGDVAKYNVKARFIMFDACFNGSFHTNEFISGEYVFGPGRTIVAQANTVNSLQDKFPDEMAGLLSYGLRVGEWNKKVCYLESHIIGDPTFRFAPVPGDMNADILMSAARSDKKLLKLLDYPQPDVQSWALSQLTGKGYKDISNILKNKYFSSPYGAVRMEALKQLALLRDDNFIIVTGAALNDSYELVRRFAAVYCQESGDPRLIPALIKAVTDPNISKRVNYHATDALAYFDKEFLLKELDKRFSDVDTTNYMGVIYRETVKKIEREHKSVSSAVETITGKDVSDKDRMFDIRSIRNNTYHTAIPDLCIYLLTAPGEKTEVALIEALGWFNYSYNRKKIIDACSKIIGSEEYSAAAKTEALRTIRRLE